jgi:RNA polymerase sigma-70 factor (ECF subfamily)
MAVTAAAEAQDQLRAAFVDEAAFRTWYDATLPRVYGFVASRCGGPGPLAEEITQLTFVEATRRHASFDGRSDVMTWLCAIARHKLADHYRKLDRDERRHRRLAVREIQVGGDQAPAAEERDAIERALRTLPAAQRAALIFRHLDGLSVHEIGSLLGKSDTAIESLLARARQGFRGAYEGQTGD